MSGSVLENSRIHACRWCNNFLLDFSSIQTVQKDDLDVSGRDIVIPMGQKRCLSTCSPNHGNLDELLSATATDECLFAKNVVQRPKSTCKDEHVQEVFSWNGGIEFIGESSSVLLQAYATWGKA